jgi:hypothetical protein
MNPAPKGVARVNGELAGAAEIGHAGDLGDHGRVAVGGQRVDDPAGEGGADDRVVHQSLTRRKVAAGVQDRDLGG